MSRKALITGCKGQLGSDLIRLLSNEYEIFAFDIEDLDIRDFSKAQSYFGKIRPQVVIHTAAYTDVDACESNAELAMSVNAVGTENIACACREIGAKMIYYSTDYVFDGLKDSAYIEEDMPNPMTVYGKSKLEGEKRIQANLRDFSILRIAWVYGAYGRNFVKTMIKLGNKQLRERKTGKEIMPIEIVDDQIGNPTWTMEIAKQTKIIISTNLQGVIHCTAEGESSWFNLAKSIFEELSMAIDIIPCATEDHPRPAPRPRHSSLENGKLKKAGLNNMRQYKEALKEFLAEHGEKLKNEI